MIHTQTNIQKSSHFCAATIVQFPSETKNLKCKCIFFGVCVCVCVLLQFSVFCGVRQNTSGGEAGACRLAVAAESFPRAFTCKFSPRAASPQPQWSSANHCLITERWISSPGLEDVDGNRPEFICRALCLLPAAGCRPRLPVLHHAGRQTAWTL